MKRLRGNTERPQVLDPIWPNVGVQAWYYAQLMRLIDDSESQLVRDVTHAWTKTPPVFKGSHITAGYGFDAALRVMAAGVAFFHENKLLLVHRTDGEGWAFPGGTVEKDETYEGAARREAFEETLYAYNGPLEPYRLQEYKGVDFATYSADVPEEFIPRLNREHDKYRWVTLPEALQMELHPGVRSTLTAKHEVLAQDAPSPTKKLQAALIKWGTQTIKRFDLASNKIAADFAARNAGATQTAMMAQLKKAGFTVKFRPTRESVEAYKVVVAENIGLIKSIGRKFHTDVEQKVWNAVRNGSDLHTLSTQLKQTYGVTTRRAALISRDQNAKAKAVMERVRQMELGFKRGVWMHSHAGKEPRPTHVAENGKPYNLAKGFFDTDENEWVHPGQLINCRCTMKPILEGYNG